MLLAFNPNALNNRIKILQSKINKRQFLNGSEYVKTSNEIIILEKYRNQINDFNSLINTPSSSISKSSTPKNVRKTRTIKRKEEKICPPGKELNPKTNRCVKIKPVSIMKIIREQKKKLEEELSKKIKECPPGKELNLVTCRCNKIKTKTIKRKEEKICPPGKELNLVTGRCNKIKNKSIKIKKENK
jgi:hypothetical protein